MTTDGMYQEAMMAALADAAVLHQPRLFAIHGLYTQRDRGHILGWGMHFSDGLGALYTDPASCATHRAMSAEGVLRTLSMVGDVELTWLTGTQPDEDDHDD